MAVRVLIADDQPVFRKAARAVVEATEGFEVVGEVESGDASIEASRRLHPDLVLMDVNMPGMNGLEATGRILKDSNGTVVVFLLSTYDEEEYAGRAAQSGAAAYIAKSRFDPARLEAAWTASQVGGARQASG